MEIASKEDAPNVEGLAMDDNVLYSTENTNSIRVWKVSQSYKLEPCGKLDASGLDFPASAAIYDKYLCTVNARLTSLPITAAEGDSEEFGEEFFMSCIDRSFDE